MGCWTLWLSWKINCLIWEVLVIKRSFIHNSSLFLCMLWNAAFQQLNSGRAVGCSLQIYKGRFKIRFLELWDGTVGIVLEALKLISIIFPSLSTVNLATENNKLFSAGLMIWNHSLQAGECLSQQEGGSVQAWQRKWVLGKAGPWRLEHTAAPVKLSLPRSFLKTISTIWDTSVYNSTLFTCGNKGMQQMHAALTWLSLEGKVEIMNSFLECGWNKALWWYHLI